jgi:hypothetical protein
MPVADLSKSGTADEDNRLQLPQVTLVAVTSMAIASTLNAMRRCIDRIQFGQALFLCDREPPAALAGPIQWRQIPPLRSRNDYSRFLLRELHSHLSTSHMLCVQWDGYVLDPSAWSPDFLDYDFIGASWPHFEDEYNVGNGGFSLRSSRLMRACAGLNYDFGEAEDVWICRTVRPVLEAEYGMRFAPTPVAKRFAFERGEPTGQEFGFHGVFNMVNFVGAKRMTHILETLEPELIARNEHWDLFRWALKRGRFALAWQVLKRLSRTR